MSGRDVLHQKLREVAEEFNASANLMITNKGYVYGAWHSKDVQLTELEKFLRSLYGAVRAFMAEEMESKQIEVSEDSTAVVIAIAYKEQVVLCGLMVSKNADIPGIKDRLQKKREELGQILNLLAL